MEIIVINPKKDFTDEQIAVLEKAGKLYFLEDKHQYDNSNILSSINEKVIALGPEVLDWSFPNSEIDKIKNLKAICLPTTGFSFVDGNYLREKGIILTNVPKYSTESVAEYAISLMLNISKKLPLVMKNGWKIDYEKHQGCELKGKTMGVVGLGTIGSRIAELGKNIGMNVIYWSRKSRNKNYVYKELDELLKEADYIFPALAKNDETHNMLNAKKLDLVKDSAFTVSITGEDIFDFNYACNLVKKGKLTGIATESEKKDMKDFEGNIWITPPIAWFTKEAFFEDMRIWVETVVSVVKDSPINKVN